MKQYITILLVVMAVNAMAQQQDSAVFTRFYYPDSSISAEGWMRQGKPDGYWKSYYPDGSLRSEGNRKDFLLDSVWVFYDNQSQINRWITYLEGRKHGLRKIYTDEGSIEVYFENDTIQGSENHYDKQKRLLYSIPYEKGVAHGLAKEFDTLGKVISVIEYRKGYIVRKEYVNRVDGNKHKQGSWKFFWENGNLQSEGYYLNDKKHGFFKYYNEEGVFQRIEKWENDVLKEDAAETKILERQLAYHPNGQIKTEAYFFRGKPEGIRKEYDSTGNVIQSYVFKNGFLTGEGIVDDNGYKQGYWKEYYEEDGALRAEGEYLNTRPVKVWKYYFPDGSIEIQGRYNKNGQKDGEWHWFYPDGKVLMIENYDNGSYDGPQFSLDEKGDTLMFGEYEEGLEVGRFIYWNDSVLEERFYLSGQKHGQWKTYYPNGQLKTLIPFEYDFQEGKTIYYHENGRVKAEYPYRDGLLHGISYIYNEEGVLLFSTTYNKGVETEYGGVKVKPQLDPDEEK
ncbi:MAG: hypothetical protein WC142_04490 [Bacteroidales bacterium]|jgi:antitoxin component YwqK of YwqJK toxin-antitoxin module|nr:hypothetical protein [Bacteroidales bacterium]MDD3330871.1 hypothetical protein [Bacteroidales bacterium]MDD3691693.1 hypothetical protein [Bacteroidales bacterium]MDD4044568.1 hypothetical protein [Bacteroidales bacterium]MDX9889537.1 hypothetical protein [Bacteroidales bacterium]